ncbi:hypothetical protein I547_2414 [Mycobacterium kansasii 824]|uniref:Uncharacterized protein n=1 Tax=Mycobacterium kansasii TaxID=1768 RepID=A0A1V3WWD9_MYCKA|nr:hypothetical protein I547_2414 [Mycobacterium kansasii 824]KEP44701.1 hypothetical protein MKSMC1_01620 [Mycobacterium kansasii]OOK71250.1 hypothetical protein BZL29_5802 [Mycobacterium kansasii]
MLMWVTALRGVLAPPIIPFGDKPRGATNLSLTVGQGEIPRTRGD